MIFYNIHDIVKISSNVEHFPDYFKTNKKLDVDFEIKEGNFEFDKDKYDKLGLKFYGGNDNLYLEYLTYGMPIQKLLISNLKGKTKFYFTKLTNSIFGVLAMASIFLEIKLLQRGCTLIHAGAISKNGKGYLIPAWSEMGKSSTIFGLAKSKKYEVLGDDNVILSKDGTIYSFPWNVGIYFHSKNVENLKLSISQKMKLRFKYLISKLPPLYLYIDPNLRIDLSKIVKVAEKAKLDKTYFIEWGDGMEDISKEVAINKIVTSTAHSVFDNYFGRETFLAYCYLNNFDPNYIENNMKKIIRKALNKCFIIRSKKKDFYKYFG